MEEYRITIAGQSKYEIELCAVQCGRDYSVTICGGGRHHVGAAALGCDESGTVGHKMRGATVSVLCVFGHRDDEAARLCVPDHLFCAFKSRADALRGRNIAANTVRKHSQASFLK